MMRPCGVFFHTPHKAACEKLMYRNPNLRQKSMTSRFIPTKPIRNSSVKRPVSVRVFVWLAIFAVAGTLICSGFVISARQHFEAVSIGYKSEELRQQEAQLQEKVNRAELERSRIISPVEMEKRALKLGLVRPLSKKAEIRRPIN
jgi:hypothetical protein